MRDAKLKAIHQQQIDYVNNSGITVEVVEIYGTVDIKGADGETIIFLQGTDGEAFVAEAHKLWMEYEDIKVAEVNELLAYPYADLGA